MTTFTHAHIRTHTHSLSHKHTHTCHVSLFYFPDFPQEHPCFEHPCFLQIPPLTTSCVSPRPASPTRSPSPRPLVPLFACVIASLRRGAGEGYLWNGSYIGVVNGDRFRLPPRSRAQRTAHPCAHLNHYFFIAHSNAPCARAEDIGGPSSKHSV